MFTISLKSARHFCLPVMLLLPLVLSGCGGGSNSGSNGSATTPQSVSAVAPDGLTATLSENTSRITPGGSITYTLMLTNHTHQTLTVIPVVGCGIDVPAVGGSVTITNASGITLYPLGGGCSEIGQGQSVTLAQGQSVSGTFTPSAVLTVAGTDSVQAGFGFIDGASRAVQSLVLGPLTVTVH